MGKDMERKLYETCIVGRYHQKWWTGLHWPALLDIQWLHALGIINPRMQAALPACEHPIIPGHHGHHGKGPLDLRSSRCRPFCPWPHRAVATAPAVWNAGASPVPGRGSMQNQEEDEELIHGFSFFSEFGWVALSILVCIRFWGDAIADLLDLAGDIA